MSLQQRISRKRSGQFFLIGAIITILSIYALSTSLERPESFDPSEVQSENLGLKYRYIIDNINSTVHSSDDSNRIQNLQALQKLLQEELAAKQYTIELKYGTDQTLPFEIEIVLKSPAVALNKTETFA